MEGPTVSGREEEPAPPGHRGETGDEDLTTVEARQGPSSRGGLRNGEGELRRPFSDKGSSCLEPTDHLEGTHTQRSGPEPQLLQLLTRRRQIRSRLSLTLKRPKMDKGWAA